MNIPTLLKTIKSAEKTSILLDDFGLPSIKLPQSDIKEMCFILDVLAFRASQLKAGLENETS